MIGRLVQMMIRLRSLFCCSKIEQDDQEYLLNEPQVVEIDPEEEERAYQRIEEAFERESLRIAEEDERYQRAEEQRRKEEERAYKENQDGHETAIWFDFDETSDEVVERDDEDEYEEEEDGADSFPLGDEPKREDRLPEK